jgi:hypothetical protein
MTYSRSPRVLSTLAAMLAMLVIGGAAALAGQAHAGPVARAARACSPPRYPGNGYFSSLKVYNTTCSTGAKVAIAWYHCRLRHGVRGHCNQPVLNFTCREKRPASSSIQFVATVTCHRGRATVFHAYEQNT